MAGKAIFRFESGNIECRWSVNHRSITNPQTTRWYSVDITTRRLAPSPLREGQNEGDFPLAHSVETLAGTGKVAKFLEQLLQSSASAPPGQSRAGKLVVPRSPGYLVRSDIVPLRLVDCPHVISVTSFADTKVHLPGHDWKLVGTADLQAVSAASAAGIILDVPEATTDAAAALDALENELQNRLSFPWLLTERRPSQTLAMLASNWRDPEKKGSGSNVFVSAQAMGINLVVLEAPGHWLADPKYASMCAAYLPINMTRDGDLADRIVAALRGYGGKIDGIFTFLESYSSHIARALITLGLPTAAPTSFEIATDKYKTSVAAGHRAYHGTSVTDALAVAEKNELRYPLIVKPCRGWSSEGVSKVDDASELQRAVAAIEADAIRHGTQFVIEEYCDGPEVDANLILCDGELIFFEVSDDFPKIGDTTDPSTVSSFLELANVLPSKLPSSELNLLNLSLHQNLKDLGFESGVFHLEARVKSSEMKYELRDGLTDLQHAPESSNASPPSSWLIEINPRPPGIQETDAVERTYGIDYVGLALAFALQDKKRARALAQPFLHGAQYWCEMVFVPVEKGGVFDSDDVCEELKLRRPDLAKYISKSLCFFKRGETVPAPDSGVNAWVAYLIVFSRESRVHLLQVAETIRKELRWTVK